MNNFPHGFGFLLLAVFFKGSDNPFIVLLICPKTQFNKQCKIKLAQTVDEAQEAVMLGPVRYIRTLERPWWSQPLSST